MENVIEWMLDTLFIGPLASWILLAVLIIVFVRSRHVLRFHSRPVRITSSVLFTFASFYFLIMTALSWGLRDGTGAMTGPDGINHSSHGLHAFARFLPPFVFHSLISAGIAAIAFFLYDTGIRQEAQ